MGRPEHEARYVVSATLTEPDWADTTVLSGDLLTAIRGLKAGPAGELHQVYRPTPR
ncbi:hypothetical protein ACFQX7_38800 [Luedemannella flava]